MRLDEAEFDLTNTEPLDGGVLVPTLYDRLKAEGLAPPDAVKTIGKRPLTEAEIEHGLSLGGDLKRATEDAAICTWIVTLSLVARDNIDKSSAPSNFSTYYRMLHYENLAIHFARKAILAFKQGAE